jgi:hypothetical protein
MATINQPPARRRRVRPILAAAWLTIFVPFVLTVINGGPTGGVLPHAAYHLAYVAVVGLAVAVLWQWRKTTTHKRARSVIVVSLTLHALAAVGHVGEAVSTALAGTYEEDGKILRGNESVHTMFANVTVPSLIAAILLLFVLTGMELRYGQRSGTERQDAVATN